MISRKFHEIPKENSQKQIQIIQKIKDFRKNSRKINENSKISKNSFGKSMKNKGNPKNQTNHK